MDRAERRPPVEREEHVMPLWLAVGDEMDLRHDHLLMSQVHLDSVFPPTEESSCHLPDHQTLQQPVRLRPRGPAPLQVRWSLSESPDPPPLHF